jgi:hypothetical protein
MGINVFDFIICNNIIGFSLISLTNDSSPPPLPSYLPHLKQRYIE